jgi:hypothetical protein
MARAPELREAIKRVIREHGPMTVTEIAEELGRSLITIGSCISTARTGKVKHFYVKTHKPQVGRSGVPAGVYAIGARKDAEPPPADRKAGDRRYYAKNKAAIKLRRTPRANNHFRSLITQVVTR